MQWYEDYPEDEDVYSDAEELLEDDELSPSESGFMSGYNEV